MDVKELEYFIHLHNTVINELDSIANIYRIKAQTDPDEKKRESAKVSVCFIEGVVKPRVEAALAMALVKSPAECKNNG